MKKGGIFGKDYVFTKEELMRKDLANVAAKVRSQSEERLRERVTEFVDRKLNEKYELLREYFKNCLLRGEPDCFIRIKWDKENADLSMEVLGATVTFKEER